MNIQIIQIKCNSCQAIIPQAGVNGAVRLSGTTIDFCATCAEKAVSFVAAIFAMPSSPKSATQKVRLANGATVMLPTTAPLPQGATVVAQS
jgi:hypothetical protein